MSYFFFQAEDGIRDIGVTGVQTCALPISPGWREDGRVDEPPYPGALRLAGRRVVVVGGGHVAQRRVPGLLAAGADVLVVSPRVTPAIEGLVTAGEVRWEARGFQPADLEGAWYVIAATDDPGV